MSDPPGRVREQARVQRRGSLTSRLLYRTGVRGRHTAPPDRHLLVTPDHSVSLTQTELVHFVRPSADLLFESVAASYKERAIAVVLSGSGHDGAMGVRAIKKMGGTVIVQDAKNAEFAGMPEAALATGSADFVLAVDEIAPALQRLCSASDE